MSRTMPFECPHGAVLDWGDFGADDGSSEPEFCQPCYEDAQTRHVEDIRKTADKVADVFAANFMDGEWSGRVAFPADRLREAVVSSVCWVLGDVECEFES